MSTTTTPARPAAPTRPEACRACGTLDVNSENRDFKIRQAAGHLLAWAIRETHQLPLEMVESIGAGFEVVPAIKLTREDLDTLKKPALEVVRKHAQLPDFNTQKQLRNTIMQRLGKDGAVVLGPEALPRLALLPVHPDEWAGRHEQRLRQAEQSAAAAAAENEAPETDEGEDLEDEAA